MKTKILFLIPNLKHGGAEKVLVNLVNNMDREKYDITVQTLFDVGVHRKNLLPHIHYRAFLKREFRGNTILFRCFSPSFWWKRIVKTHYDIAVSYLEGPTTRILTGCTDEDTKRISWLHIELNTPRLAAQGFRSISEAKKGYEHFNRIIAVSQNVRDCFIQNLQLHHPVEVLYNTNETERIQQKAQAQVENARFVTDAVPTVISVAKLMKTKGYDRLLEVHKRLMVEGLKHRIYILGIGEEQGYLEGKIKKYGLEQSFILLGYDENPYKYLSGADFYVCASRREGFSTAVTEALVVGIPVVSTNCSGAKELLGEHDEYGLVVENSTEGIYEGMKKLLCNPALLEHYSEQAKVRGSCFSREKTVKAVEEMLEGL